MPDKPIIHVRPNGVISFGGTVPENAIVLQDLPDADVRKICQLILEQSDAIEKDLSEANARLADANAKLDEAKADSNKKFTKNTILTVVLCVIFIVVGFIGSPVIEMLRPDLILLIHNLSSK